MSQPARFYQREIKSFNTRSGWIISARLSCGHVEPYKRRRPAGSKRTTMPCSRCGYAYRTQWERERDERRFERTIRDAARDPDGLDRLVRLCRLTLAITAARPLGSDQRELWDDVEQVAREIGLRAKPSERSE